MSHRKHAYWERGGDFDQNFTASFVGVSRLADVSSNNGSSEQVEAEALTEKHFLRVVIVEGSKISLKLTLCWKVAWSSTISESCKKWPKFLALDLCSKLRLSSRIILARYVL